MKTFIGNIFSAISDNLISGGAYYLIIKGILVTFLITVAAFIIAALVGVAVSYIMAYDKKAVSVIGRCICFIFRTVPLPLTLWLFYYCVFGKSSKMGILISIISIGLWGGGQLSEILARAVKLRNARLSESVASSLGRVYFTVTAPQAAQDSIFHIKRLFSLLLAWSTVAGYIGVNDLTQVMFEIGQRTLYPFFSIAFTAILYMLANVLVDLVFAFIAKKLGMESDAPEV